MDAMMNKDRKEQRRVNFVFKHAILACKQALKRLPGKI